MCVFKGNKLYDIKQRTKKVNNKARSQNWFLLMTLLSVCQIAQFKVASGQSQSNLYQRPPLNKDHLVNRVFRDRIKQRNF